MRKTIGENRTYKKHEARQEVEKWCEMYPGYRRVVEDIRYTLRRRECRSSVSYPIRFNGRTVIGGLH